ncbi:MAG TPA: hypothetical protein VGR70_09840, partial [Stellaceae bacterium]|nr:hypothetical protein [Stellaceae bacterium]
MRLVIVFVAMLVIGAGSARADDPPAAAPPMSGWFENLIARFETEAIHDVSMAPVVSSALSREWRSFDRDGSAAAV